MVIIASELFLKEAGFIPVIDVRSPSEFQQGHVPGAVNIPLFNDEERKKVGTLYKNSGRDTAFMAGLDLVGPKLAAMVKEAKKTAIGKRLIVHCWRGGLRSKNMSWLFETAGLEVMLLEGGYKAYRRFIRQEQYNYTNMLVLGGYTGSGKSDILNALEENGEQVIDLEGLAHHKGSAFGHLGQEGQPTTEQFENNLFHILAGHDKEKPIWVEDESRAIGRISIPDPFYKTMRVAPILFIETPLNFRVKRLVDEYAGFEKEKLVAAVTRITKRLGGQNAKTAIDAIQNDNFEEVSSILLVYYDKAYLIGLSERDQKLVFKLDVYDEDYKKVAEDVLNFVQNNSSLKKLLFKDN